ncbi:MAG: hypothetical protein ACTTKI_06435 [Tannerella sp.]|uniref:hypothetical protein n=1 Tax=Tannerella sp. TaxID=2382127 RepID=UPI003FA29575
MMTAKNARLEANASAGIFHNRPYGGSPTQPYFNSISNTSSAGSVRSALPFPWFLLSLRPQKNKSTHDYN